MPRADQGTGLVDRVLTQQDQRKRHLEDHEPVAQPARFASARGAGSHTGMEPRRPTVPAGMERRDYTEEYCTHCRDGHGEAVSP